YHIEFGGGRRIPSFGFMGNIHLYAGAQGLGTPPPGIGYGKKLKDDYRRLWGSIVGLSGRGEMLPNRDCYCEIDPTVVDRWGIPVLRFHWQWSDHEHNQVKHMHETFRALVAQMGGEVFSPMPTAERGYGITAGGQIIHELGCTRMGSDPESSVVDANCRAHDCRNLFIADGGPFVSQADKNPTWTILALAWRTSDFIAGQRRQGDL
ncbi:MAG TPA: GMC family oxidoreductase, partial [Gemmatimonadaceae bacterium]|nr:GMC family oxidoreductase [Gemmatimonadaceae bacterium]